jgi:hypothetical protein
MKIDEIQEIYSYSEIYIYKHYTSSVFKYDYMYNIFTVSEDNKTILFFT